MYDFRCFNLNSSYPNTIINHNDVNISPNCLNFQFSQFCLTNFNEFLLLKGKSAFCQIHVTISLHSHTLVHFLLTPFISKYKMYFNSRRIKIHPRNLPEQHKMPAYVRPHLLLRVNQLQVLFQDHEQRHLSSDLCVHSCVCVCLRFSTVKSVSYGKCHC